ncbi:MAG: hypothetical protein ABI772_13570, partial [Bacteroidota bacterium]
ACGGNGVNSAQSLYAFSPLLNSWISKAAYPVNPAPQDCFGFAIGNKGYVVGGWNGSTQDDCYEYDATNDSWTQKTSFPGGNRSGITGFVIGNLAYVGTGFFNGGYYTDFYSYDPSNDTWALRTAFPGAARCSGSGFSIGNYGYMGIGYDGANFFHDFWKYDPQNDSWVTVNNYPGNGGEYSAAFTIGGRGFVGTGGTNGGPYYNNYFEFTDATSEITESKKSSDIKVTYSGIENYIYISSENNFTENLIFNLYNNNGQLVCSKHLKSSENSTTIHLQKKVAGSFFYSITGGNKINISGKIDIL